MARRGRIDAKHVTVALALQGPAHCGHLAVVTPHHEESIPSVSRRIERKHFCQKCGHQVFHGQREPNRVELCSRVAFRRLRSL